MIMPAPPITFNYSGAQSSSQLQSAPDPNSPDFMRLLIAEMANPDVSSLFSSADDDNSSDPFASFYSSSNPLASLYGSSSYDTANNSYFGTSGSYLGATTNTIANLYNYQTPTTSGLTLQMEMSIWSNLIGKTVKGIDSQTGIVISGKVNSVVLDQTTNTVKLDVDGTLVDPNSVTKVN